MRWNAVLLRAVLVSGFAFFTAFGQDAARVLSAEMWRFPVHDAAGVEVAPAVSTTGKATLFTRPSGAAMVVRAAGLVPGEVVTAWWVVFNQPEFCSDAACGEDDVFPFPGNQAAGFSLAWGDGQLVGADGTALFFGELPAQDAGLALFGPGLTRPLTAEIHLVLRTHGPPLPGLKDAQLNSYGGGCEAVPTPCRDVQFAVFQQAPLARQVRGDEAPLGDGTARAWVELDASGAPAAVGVSISEAALNSLPQGPGFYDLTLHLPSEAAGTPFAHVFLNWNPRGHEPEGVYDLPHFDVHFVMTPVAAREAITIGPDCEAHPLSLFLPDGYAPIPGCVPQMGAHWVDPTSPEFLGQPFSATLIYGSHDGRVTFIEPMVTLALMRGGVDFSAPVKQPRFVLERGRYFPTAYSVRADAARGEVRIALEGMVRR